MENLVATIKDTSLMKSILKCVLNLLQSQSTALRKQAYKVLSCYTKMTGDLELVIELVLSSGFCSETDRLRQHSMLIIPVLLTVKQSFVSDKGYEFVRLIKCVAERLEDTSPIVSRTAKRLLLELNKSYEDTLRRVYEGLDK